jgi:hypothetical protein
MLAHTLTLLTLGCLITSNVAAPISGSGIARRDIDNIAYPEAFAERRDTAMPEKREPETMNINRRMVAPERRTSAGPEKRDPEAENPRNGGDNKRTVAPQKRMQNQNRGLIAALDDDGDDATAVEYALDDDTYNPTAVEYRRDAVAPEKRMQGERRSETNWGRRSGTNWD